MVFFGKRGANISVAGLFCPQQLTEQETGLTDFHPALADAELANNDSRAVTINGSKVLILSRGGRALRSGKSVHASGG